MELCHVCIQLTPNGIPGFIVQGHVGFPGHLPRVKSPWETSPSRGPGGHSLFSPQLFGSLAPWWNLRGCGNGWFRSETGGWNGAEFIQAGELEHVKVTAQTRVWIRIGGKQYKRWDCGDGLFSNHMTNLSDLCTMVAQCKVAIFLNGLKKHAASFRSA